MKNLRYWLGRPLRLLALLMVLSSLLSVTGCGSSPLSLLTGGGPNVAANVQAGKTNQQTVGNSQVVEQKLVRPQADTIKQSNDTQRVKADEVQTVVVNEVPAWVIFLLLLGWMLPSPNEIARKVHSLWQRNQT